MSRSSTTAVRLAVICATTAATIGLSATASAQSPDGVSEIVLGGISGDEVLPVQVDGLHPGGPIATARYVLRRGAGFSGGSFSIAVEALEDYDRGCNRPETNSGDTTCGDGPDQGELSQQLLLGQAWSDDVEDCADAASPTSGTPLRDVEELVQSAPAALSQQDAVCLVLSAALPLSADNLAQSDQVVFDLRLGLTDAEPVEVLSESLERMTPGAAAGSSGTGGSGVTAATFGTPRPSALPFTGTTLLTAALWAVVLVALGVALASVGRRRSN